MDIFEAFVLIWVVVFMLYFLWLLPGAIYELWWALWKMPRMTQEERDAHVAWWVREDLDK